MLNTYGIYTNSSNKVNTVGAGLGLQYTLPKGFFVGGNFAYNDLSNADANVLTQFNTPKIKYNISVGNYTIKKVFGFNMTYRWQDSYVLSILICFRKYGCVWSTGCTDQHETSKIEEQHDQDRRKQSVKQILYGCHWKFPGRRVVLCESGI